MLMLLCWLTYVQRGVVRQILGEARAFRQIPSVKFWGLSGLVRQILAYTAYIPEGPRTSDTVAIDYSTYYSLVNNKTTQNGKYPKYDIDKLQASQASWPVSEFRSEIFRINCISWN